jgi:hypothetical protein
LVKARWTRSKPSLTSAARDPWFQSHPELIDRLDSVLTKLYLDGEGPEWETIWEQVRTVLERTTNTPLDRCQALAALLQGVVG